MKSAVSFAFKRYPEDKFFNYADGVVLPMATDPQFVSLKPEVETSKKLLTDYKNFVQDPNAGGALFVVQKTVKRSATIDQFELLGKLMDIFAKGDPAIILSSGHELNTGTVAPVSTSFGAPTLTKVKKGDLSGSATLRWSKIDGAHHYNIEWRVQGQEKWTGSTSCGTISITLYDLALRTVVDFRVQSVKSDGTKSEWSAILDYWVTT